MDIQNYYEEFIAKLQEIFMMDHAELDFGIYRIMNQKRDDIMDFLENRLLKQVGSSLDIDEKEVEKLQKRQKEILQMAGGDISVLPPAIPLRQEYDANEEQLRRMGNPEELRNEVFSHLVTFFSRYYDGGDFLSKRRYKGDTYAIPYNGEEVKLHWANSDQYYIKTSEYFRDYTFELPQSHRKVHFVLKDVSTELNNNKSDKGKERRFALYESEDKEEKVMEVAENGNLNIYFTYELWPKTTKQEELVADAIEKISTSLPADFQELVTTILPLPKKPNRTLLEKHLTDYTAKNSFDYFIHKNLGAFLKRELDFYLKNEVINIDDLDDINIKKRLGVAKAIKNVGVKIIQMLAQLEDFQKKLWLKKKFVVQSDYCITLDRVPECLYSDIIANEAQRKEWVRLFAIDEIKGDLMKEGYSEPLTIEFLKQNPYLVLDTAFFDAKFKHKLIASMENIDEQMNGLLINSENFQAIKLLQAKFSKALKCVYIDPPFNLKVNGDFLYRTDYKDSTWSTLLSNRVKETIPLLGDNAFFYLRCDNNGNFLVRSILDSLFGSDNFLAELLVQRIRKNVTNQGRITLPLANDSLFLYTNTDNYIFNNPYKKLKGKREEYWRRVDDSAGFRNPPERNIFGKTFLPYKHDAHFKYSQSSMERMIDEGKLRIICKQCGEPHYKGLWVKCPVCGCTEAMPQYKVDETDEQILDTNWLDVAGYSSKTGFSTENAEVLLNRAIEVCSSEGDIVCDYFGGSGTTMAVAMEKNRKWIGVEMGEQYDVYIVPRMKEVLGRHPGYFKYIRLEQYEDTLNNLKPKKQELEFEDDFKDGYMLNYLLDTEYRESLLDIKMFFNPFSNELNITRNNEQIPTKVDMVDTFNYLIGLNVEKERWFDDDNICVVKGDTHRDHLRTVVLWRNQEKVDNAKLAEWFEKPELRDLAKDADIIYVNGENTLQSKIHEDENWQIMLTDEEFLNRMFEEE